MTGNKYGRTHRQGRVPNNCTRIGKIFGTTVKICKVLVVIYESTARIAVGIVTISEWIDGSPSVGIHNRRPPSVSSWK